MKKYLAFLISIIMTVSLLGCGSSPENDSASKKPDDIALMSYAQTVLEDLYPGCEYSHEKSDSMIHMILYHYRLEMRKFMKTIDCRRHPNLRSIIIMKF